MQCPICSVELVMSERQGIEIDYCPKCRGVWLDRGELDKIIERSAQVSPPPKPSEPFPAQGQPYHPQGQPHYRHPEQHKPHHGHKRMKSFLEEIFD